MLLEPCVAHGSAMSFASTHAQMFQFGCPYTIKNKMMQSCGYPLYMLCSTLATSVRERMLRYTVLFTRHVKNPLGICASFVAKTRLHPV